MRKVYICGPVTGLPYDEVQYSFNKAEQMLKGMGMIPINPLALVPDPETHWKGAMRACIKGLMDADAVMLLEGWTWSKGANVEVQLANILGMRVIEIKYFESKMNDDEPETVLECRK